MGGGERRDGEEGMERWKEKGKGMERRNVNWREKENFIQKKGTDGTYFNTPSPSRYSNFHRPPTNW